MANQLSDSIWIGSIPYDPYYLQQQLANQPAYAASLAQQQYAQHHASALQQYQRAQVKAKSADMGSAESWLRQRVGEICALAPQVRH